MYDSYLAHHGIKGMKWGVRRYQNYDGTRTALGKKRERLFRNEPTKQELLKTTDAKILYKHKDRLTDQELRERVNRIQTEQQLRQLVINSNKQSSGAKIAKSVFDKVGKLAVTALSAYIFKTGKSAVPKVLATLGTIAVSTAIGEEIVDAYNSLEILENIGK